MSSIATAAVAPSSSSNAITPGDQSPYNATPYQDPEHGCLATTHLLTPADGLTHASKEATLTSGSQTLQGDANTNSGISDGRWAKVIQGHLDTIVIIATLLSAVNAAFVYEGFKNLEPNQLPLTGEQFRNLLLVSQNTTALLEALSRSEPQKDCAIRAHRCMVASLCLCLAAVCGAIAGKDATLHWGYRTRCNQPRRLQSCVRFLLSVLHWTIFAAIITFFVGFYYQASGIDSATKRIVIGLFTLSLFLYLAPTILLPLIYKVTPEVRQERHRGLCS